MLKKSAVYFEAYDGPAPEASRQLEQIGYAVERNVFTRDETDALAAEIDNVYRSTARDERAAGRPAEEDEDFRYEMFNRSPQAQRAVAHPRILEVIEPLLGGDCHIIANTCWRNPPNRPSQHGGGFWHIDSGPHVPRPEGIPWDERIPYPVFAIGTHIFLNACDIHSGPTGVLPGSHKSGQHPPFDRVQDNSLTYEGREAVPLTADAGDVAFFVSDVWHRRLPTTAQDQGRFFLQVHYGRRDIAQRIHTTEQVNQVSPEARARIASEREATLLGLHKPLFYDG